MADGYHAPTEKEKAALRLLLAGHDAKSMARHLGLSVHTVNERLRDARRKLSVSSSKAAARILNEAEATPHLPGDKSFGDAGPVASGQTLDPGPAQSRHRAAWTIGGFAMIALFVAALAIATPQTAAPPAPATAAHVPESDASQAARDWLALVDARKWPESWAATGASFQRVNSIANWQGAAEQVHARLGAALTRDLLSDQDIPAPP